MSYYTICDDSGSDNKKEELKLKDYISPLVYRCLSKFYRTGRLGYLTMIGGEAINKYLDEGKKLETGDFDLKFVVNPEFNEDEKALVRANSLRLRVASALYECIQEIDPPPGYTQFYAKLGLLVNRKFHLTYIDDGKMFFVNRLTGEEQFTHYKTNKTFKIVLYYQKKGEELKCFDLVDLGLFYRKKLSFSFFEGDIYDTFLKPPFNMKLPIPFVVRKEIRIPTLPFLLFDNYRMLLISFDNINIMKESKEDREFWMKKMEKYWNKVERMIEVLKRKNSKEKMDKLIQGMKDSVALYEPLAYFNMICRRRGNVYSKEILERQECGEDYLAKLKVFEEAYYQVGDAVRTLRF